jgi:hypothetical protein
METPSVVNVAIDQQKNIRYEVIAYRQLSQAETVQAVRMAVAMMKKKPRKNMVYRS